jgi:hypothetical protein
MKRQLLFVALLVIGFNASAQFTKGEKVLSGNISFNTNKNVSTSGTTLQEYSVTSFSLNTGIGWVKSEKRISGLRIGYYNGFSKNAITSQSTLSNNTITLGVFNQNIKSFNQHLFGFFETNLNSGYSWREFKDANSTTSNFDYKSYAVAANANIGLGYRITKHLIADATLSNLLSISYSHSDPANSSTSSTNNKSDNFSISTGLSSLSLNSVAIGFRWVFQ